MNIAEKIESLLQQKLEENPVLGRDKNCSPFALIIAKEKILDVCKILYEDPELYFDLLSCITGIDNGPEKDTMEVVYNLYSIALNHQITLKTELPRAQPQVQSVTNIWKTADWHEREAFDLLGIVFEGHPDMRRILMPGDWIGHPLRKDYVEPETYRGMRTVRDEEQEKTGE